MGLYSFSDTWNKNHRPVNGFLIGGGKEMRVYCRALHGSHLLRTDPGEGVERVHGHEKGH